MGIEERHGARTAEVDFGGVRKDVCLQYLPEITVGEYVIVHVGFAIQRLDERSALASLATFARMGLLTEELGDGADGVSATARGAGEEEGMTR